MSFMIRFLATLLISGAALLAADAPSVARIYDGELKMIESEFVPLVEAMPPDKFNFAPKNGDFSGVRTFSQQATHVAAVIYAVSASVLGEKNPTEMGQSENGPASLKNKDEVVKYVKDAFAYGHKAMLSLSSENLTTMVKSAFGNNETPRASMASASVWHSFDHYGQMVVYARMNGVVPPASRR
jgi:uncharacterized damage-inducible protein DinB